MLILTWIIILHVYLYDIIPLVYKTSVCVIEGENQCPEMRRPSNGGLVCYNHRATSTERCQVTCNRGTQQNFS